MTKVNQLPLFDIYQISWLDLNGVEITPRREGTRVVFYVAACEKTYQLLRAYERNPQVPLLDIVRSLRRMRSRMLDERDGKEKWQRRNHGHDKQSEL